ncbi:heterokaryon incompatibility protein-domain-containing protein [Xylogone sp. PMI_703]|nr:heterokaryon incompatibility protein-domain-containing protein [Xylogone sp. PMI_703]
MSPCNCSPLLSQSSSLEGQHLIREQPNWVFKADNLCSQCLDIDFDAILASRETADNLQLWLSSSKESSCGICRFIVAVAAGTGFADQTNEIKFRLFAERVYGAYHNLLYKAGGATAFQDYYVLKVLVEQAPSSYLQFNLAPLPNAAAGAKQPTFAARQLQASSIDFGVLKGWLAYCDTHHPATCHKISGYPQDIPGLRVIDCQTKSVIEAPDNCEFAALSYVWGSTYSKDMLESAARGALPQEVPATIDDAIQVVCKLGLRYLWVDQCCIDQSNVAEVRQQVSIMDIIYNLASVTIVAACGQGSDYGLPGIGSRMRVQQPSICINDRIWVSSFEDPVSKIQRSKWFTRGWTYQEGIFSRRRLVFSDEQVYFECNNTRCQETVAYDLHLLDDKMVFQPQGLFHGGFSFDFGPEGGLDMHIRNYTKRNLTNPEDAISALLGIFRAFSVMPSPIRHFWGIPLDYYAGSLCSWRPSTFLLPKNAPGILPPSADTIFAAGLTWFLDKPATRRPGFPSWSWAGWMGPLSTYTGWGQFNGLLNSDIKIWLQRTDGKYDRLDEPVIVDIGQSIFPASDYLPRLRIEALVVEMSFGYYPGGLGNIQYYGTGNSSPQYFTSVSVTDEISGDQCGTLLWPLILSVSHSFGDELHNELLRDKFDCILLYMQSAFLFGLVVRKEGDVAQRLGHIDFVRSHFEALSSSDTPSRDQYNNWQKQRPLDYLSPKRLTIDLV